MPINGSRDFRDFYDGGFTRFPNRLFGTFLPTQAATYLRLRRNENMHGGSHPSVATVSNGVGKSRRTVQYAIEALEEAGEIKRESRGRNRPCRYIFTEVLDDSGRETFTKVPNWVLERGLSPEVLMVYVTILEVWNVDKTLRLEDIARKCRISKSTADRAVQELDRRRLIAVHRDKYRIKRNRYEILPCQLSDQGRTGTAHSETASDLRSTLTAHPGTETAYRGTETAHGLVPGLRTNKTHLQQDSPKEDSFGNKTRPPSAPGSAGERRVSGVDLAQPDGQGLTGVAPEDIEFLASVIRAPHPGNCDWGQIRQVEIAMMRHPYYVEMLASLDGMVAPKVTARERFLAQCPDYRYAWDVAHGDWLDTVAPESGGLNLAHRLAAARDSDLTPEERRQRHKQNLAERLAKFR
ncbi:hypothetical protein CRM90_12010 [Mycobacterium sp. ENV421]|nr:hypothetical protein CRM90_12010 [Mycobacterium sp. ENV421]